MAENTDAIHINNFNYISDDDFRTCLNTLAIENAWTSATQFTFIKCHNGSIQSIAGIKKFTNITKLSLYKNKLTSAELAGLIQLQHLNLAGNNLTELQLTDLPSLEECYVFKNQLTQLSIENTPVLSKLKANNNKLNTLSFSNSKQLSKLYIFDNDLKKVEMSTLPVLTYLDARHNPMPDDFYDFLDSVESLTALHDGNAEDWQ